MNILERRRLRKAKKHILHESRHARYMREDIVDAEEIGKLSELEAEIQSAWKSEDPDRMEEAYTAIDQQIKKVYPAVGGSPKIRENVEIVVVALAVALGFRTYFIQPFKIPTGSMQPTLNGIRIDQEQKGANTSDRFPIGTLKYLFTGVKYKEVRAKASGYISRIGMADNYVVYNIDGKRHKILGEMRKYFQESEYVNKGDILASGRVLSGDHILVNKMKYNFSPPERGEIVVFNTKTIRHSDIKPDAFYIKRLVGMPGEDVSLSANGYLCVSGEAILEPKIFNWTFADKYGDSKNITVNENDIQYAEQGYFRMRQKSLPRDQGPYLFGRGALNDENDLVELSDEEYLFFGDNTMSSLDGRYFGGVHRSSVIGPAFAVYWPFAKRAKIIRNQ